ncbi:MAG: mechanosensitive ion channel [Oscillospiraceae bacterium]|nr:mechanosensitive ion channel [Oscillospiraceae bacterium]
MGFSDKLDEALKTSWGSLSLMDVLSAVLVFLVCLVVITIILRVVDHIQARSKLDNTINSFIRSGIKVALWIIAIIIIADKLGIETSSLVALVGVAGLALSLSIQGLLSNLFSGITTLTTKPFVAGDFVEFDGVTGTVSKVELFYTTITTVENKLVYVPNSQVASAKIINFTRETNRRVDLVFSASYEASTEEVKAALLSAAEADERVLKTPEPFTGLLEYKQSSIEYALRVWAKKEDCVNVKFALNESVREIFKERGIEMSYDHLNVHMVNS